MKVKKFWLKVSRDFYRKPPNEKISSAIFLRNSKKKCNTLFLGSCPYLSRVWPNHLMCMNHSSCASMRFMSYYFEHMWCRLEIVSMFFYCDMTLMYMFKLVQLTIGNEWVWNQDLMTMYVFHYNNNALIYSLNQ